MRTILAVLLLAGTSYSSDNAIPPSVTVDTGALATLSASKESTMPMALITVDSPIPVSKWVPARLEVRLGLWSHPGMEVDLQDAETFHGGTFTLSAYRTLGGLEYEGGKVVFGPVVTWGMTAPILLDEEDQKPDRMARHYGVGLRLGEIKSGASVCVVWGRAEAVGPWENGQWTIRGRIPLPLTSGTVIILGEMHLGAGPARDGQRDVWRVGSAVNLLRIVEIVK